MRRKKLLALDRVLQRLALSRMFLLLAALSVIAIGALGYLGEQMLESRQHQLVQSMVRLVDAYLDRAARTLDAAARAVEITPSGNLAFMQGILESYGCYDTLYHLDPGSRIRLLVPPDPRCPALDMSNLPCFKQAGVKKNLIISRPFISLRSGNPTVYLIKQLARGGWVVGELNLESLQDEIVRERSAPDQGAVLVLDQFGMLLAHPSYSLVKQQTNLGDLEIFRRGLGGEATLVYRYAGRLVLGSAARIERAGWVVVDQVPLSVVFSAYAWALGLTLPALLIIWLALTWNLRRQLQRRVVIPLVQVSRGMDALANGDFSRGKALAAIPAASAELTALSTDFQQMSDALEARQAALQESEERYRRLFRTERKQAEQSIRKLSQAIEQSPVSIVITDVEGKIEFVNAKFTQITGYEHDEVIGRRPSILKSGETPGEEYSRLWQTIGSGGIWQGEFHNRKKNGELFWEQATIAPVRDGDNVITHYVAVKEDITERKILEEQLRQTQKMEAVGQLAGGVAHDFNNMLGVIIGHTELALTKVAPHDALRKNLQEILAAAFRSSEITRQLLAFARKQTIAPRVLDLNETVEGMLKLLRRLIGEDIDLAWAPGAKLWPVNMDPSQIDQILANLCVNARDAIAGVGKITIETQKIVFDNAYCAEHRGFSPGEYVMLEVSDTGSGMDKATMEKIFEPFFTTKGLGKGTGLGLATVYGIVKQNAGFINAYSEPGLGSTFKVYLPRHAAPSSREPKAGPEPQELSGHETILVAEDEVLQLELVEMMLESYGYQVLAASSPGEALLAAKRHKGEIHLLLTDLIMPEMNGRELSKEMSALYPNMLCLFMSGYTNDIIVHQGILDEGVQFIQKPFSMQNLALKVREILDAG